MPHDHDHPHALLPPEPALRVRALETLLARKGLVDPAAIDEIVEIYEHKVGPRTAPASWRGPGPIPSSWRRCGRTPRPLSRPMGYGGRQGEHVVAVENTPEVHNVVVCTLCSCYPWPLLGIPPIVVQVRRLSRPRRARAARACWPSSGWSCRPTRKVRVWDSTAEVRYLVIPMRPEGTEGLDEDALARWVTRDAMIGTGLPRRPGA